MSGDFHLPRGSSMVHERSRMFRNIHEHSQTFTIIHDIYKHSQMFTKTREFYRSISEMEMFKPAALLHRNSGGNATTTEPGSVPIISQQK